MCRAASMLPTAAVTVDGTQEGAVADEVVEAHQEINRVGRVRAVKAEKEKERVDILSVMDAHHPAALTGPAVVIGDPHVATEVVVIVSKNNIVERVVIAVMQQRESVNL